MVLARPRSGVDARRYDAAAASTVQTFETAPTKVSAVTLRVRSNHGHADYTCVYRFRVHGAPY